MTRCIFIFLRTLFSFLDIPQCVDNVCSRDILVEYNRSSSTKTSFSIALSWKLLQSKRPLRVPSMCVKGWKWQQKSDTLAYFPGYKNLDFAFETRRKIYMSSAVFINAQNFNKDPPDKRVWIPSPLNCDGVTEFSSAQSACDRRHPRAKLFHQSWEILSNQCQFDYMKESSKRWWVHLKWCSGLHLGLVQSLRKNRKTLSASIPFSVENEQTGFYHFTW